MKSAFLLLAFLSLVLQSHAAHFTTTVAQAIGSSWNDAIWQPGPTVPTAGNTYEVLNGGLVRNPAVTSSTFPGDSLQLGPIDFPINHKCPPSPHFADGQAHVPNGHLG